MVFPKTQSLAEPFSLAHAEFFEFFFFEMGFEDKLDSLSLVFF